MTWRAEEIPAAVHADPESHIDADMRFWIRDEDGNVIATVDRCRGDEEAHARLLASAPDLLSALKLLISHLRHGERWPTKGEHNSYLLMTEDAIRKAEGGDVC